MHYYLVKAYRKDDNKELYAALDLDSGYPTFTISMHSAVQFETAKSAEEFLMTNYKSLLQSYVDQNKFEIICFSFDVVKTMRADEQLLQQMRREEALRKLNDEDKKVLGLL